MEKQRIRCPKEPEMGLVYRERCSVGVWRPLLWLSLVGLFCGCPAWSRQLPETGQSIESQAQGASPGAQPRAQEQPGSISGKVVDQSGTPVEGAEVRCTCQGASSELVATTNGDGLFAFTSVAPGPFKLTISSPDLTPQEFSGTVSAGGRFETPLIMLVIPTQMTEVRVLPRDEIESAQIKEQEKQRVLGLIPNFYVSYTADAVPLTAKHKFELAWKSASDPVTLAGVGFLAGISQAADRWHDYGQGAEGYAKRFGATYANVFTATIIGGAVMPTILKQDPRYFYKGSGSKKSRLLYSIASSVICKGDNGHWQPNYSNVIGSVAGAGIATLYIPQSDRGGAFVLSSTLIRLGETSLAGVLQEFLFRKLTPNSPRRAAGQP
jgi:hypothetical protein